MIDLYKLTPEEFECMCYDYICAEYNNNNNYQLKHTRYIHDGGRDIEIAFYDELSYFKIWAECKQHKRNIGLDDIGKNVVLVISKHVHKVIFFSASEITEPAKIEIINIGDKLNFHVSFLCGDRLINEIKTKPEILEKYFNGTSVNTSLSRKETITVTSSISEFESSFLIPITKQEQIYLHNGEWFNIYIRLSNQCKEPITDITIELLSINDELLIDKSKISYTFLGLQEDTIAHFKGKIINVQSNIIDLPKVIINYKLGCSDKKEFITLPPFNISKCRRYPFIGKSVTEFMSHNVKNALEWSDRNYAHIFDIRGISGSGKSRLAIEIQKKAIEKLGLFPININSFDFIDFDIIHKLLCELLHLPFYKGSINYTKEDIKELIEIQGGSSTFSDIISQFMQTGVWRKKDSNYIIESIVYFLQKPYHEKGYCISIDNTQMLHPEVLKILMRLSDLLIKNQNRTILILISNTERQPLSSKTFDAFLSYFDEKSKEHNSFVSPYVCTSFREDDVKLFLMNTLQFKTQNDLLLKKMIQKIGWLPFEITMTLGYLDDKEIIKWNSMNELVISDYERFDEFIEVGLPKSKGILADRMCAWKETHLKSINSKFIDVLSTLIAFDGLVPYNYISDSRFDYDLIDEMISKLWIIPNTSGRGLSFYHDNIKEYCNTLPQCKNNTRVLRNIHNWLKKNMDINIVNFEITKFSCYYYLDQFNEALKYGIEILTDDSVLSHTETVKISKILYEDERTRMDKIVFVRISSIYANAVFSLDNKELGCKIFQNTIKYIKENDIAIEVTEYCKLLHNAINSQLQSAQYENAIEWLGILNGLNNIPLKYQFIVENRYGVTYIALGQFEEAYKHLNSSLTIASETMEDPYWTSTTHSDIALFYFYNWKKVGKDVATEKIINEFKLALNDYKLSIEQNTSRDIEMSWHKAFIGILKKQYSSAIEQADICIDLSLKNNQLYELSRGYNLRALAEFYNDDIIASQNSLEEGLHSCILYDFPSGIFRLYNNIGVIYFSKNDFVKAHYYFDLALNAIGAKIEYKQYPILINLLLTSIMLNNKGLEDQIDHRIKNIPCNELFEYYKMIYINKQKLNQINSFSFWGINGANYIF